MKTVERSCATPLTSTWRRFEEDRKTYDAVERCLERLAEVRHAGPGRNSLSEAAAKLEDLRPSFYLLSPDKKIRALGNRLRHAYDAIREDRLGNIVENDVAPLCSACEEALRRLREVQGSP